tara:strand:+ start:617 stop:925 length:309 start_codon:yes stop_codon:yes gene_type:complete
MKKTTQNASGTSYHGNTITCTPDTLIGLLGAPSYDDNQGYDKVNLSWTCETSNGELFTIYDWKTYSPVRMNQMVHWHIGAKESSIATNATEELNSTLDNKHN